MSSVSDFCQNCAPLLSPPPNHESPCSARAAELLRCNDAPFDFELAVFKRDITEWESNVTDLRQKIARLQELLDTLFAARIHAEVRLNNAKSLLRPICHVPNEILMQIFRFCIPPQFPYRANAYNALDSTTVPWTLTRVCRRFRNLARSLPGLWSCVKVDFAGHRPITGFKAKMFVDLAGDVPISVYVFSREALQSLRGSEHRWKSLRISLRKDDYRGLQGTSFPSLETLDVSVRPLADDLFDVEVFNAVDAPNLRTLIGSYSALRYLELPWTQLTDVTVTGYFQAPLKPYLEPMTKLERLKLLVPSEESTVPVVLPRVSYLSLTEPTNIPTGSLKKLLECMVLPRLSNLHLSFTEPSPAAPRDSYFPTTLDSTLNLTTLHIDVEMSNPPTNVELLLDFLWLTPHVKEFTIVSSASWDGRERKRRTGGGLCHHRVRTSCGPPVPWANWRFNNNNNNQFLPQGSVRPGHDACSWESMPPPRDD